MFEQVVEELVDAIDDYADTPLAEAEDLWGAVEEALLNVKYELHRRKKTHWDTVHETTRKKTSD